MHRQINYTDQDRWNAQVLIHNRKRLKAKQVVLTFWHYKAARLMTGTWDIKDTIEALEKDFVLLDKEAFILQAENAAKSRATPTKGSLCGRCYNGMVLTDRGAKPCGCNGHVEAKFQQYRLTTFGR